MKKFLLSFFSVLMLMFITCTNTFANNNSLNNPDKENVFGKSDSRADFTVTITASETSPICSNAIAGGMVTFTANITGTPTPDYSVQWIGAIKSSNDLVATLTIAPETCNRTYNISVTIIDADGDTAAAQTTFIVEDNEPPTITGTLSAQFLEGCHPDDLVTIYPAEDNIASLIASFGLAITDNCSIDSDLFTVTHIDRPENACQSEITRIYTITDACGNSTTISQNIILTRPPFTINPDPDPKDIECIAQAVPPPLTVVPNDCGDSIPPVLLSIIDNPNPLLCAGTRIFEYSYTDPCSGHEEIWRYTYNINPPGFELPDGNHVDITVGCPSEVTEPVPPILPVIYDTICGSRIPHTLLGYVDSQTPLTCNSTRTYTYRFDDCLGNNKVWECTYIIGTASTFVINVPDTVVTVNCVDDIVMPTSDMLPTVYDTCGGEVTKPTVPTGIFEEPDGLLTCAGSRRYEYTYYDCSGNSATWNYIFNVVPPTFTLPDDPDPVLVGCIYEMVEPTPPDNVPDFCENIITDIQLTDTIDSPSPLTCEGTRKYVYTYTDCAGNTKNWTYTYKIEDMPSFQPTFADGDTTVNCPSDVFQPDSFIPNGIVDGCGNEITTIICTGYTPTGPITCNGDRTYHYTFYDCTGDTAVWNFTFHVEIPPLVITAAPGVAYVKCVSDAANPPTTIPTIRDACGNILTPSAPSVSSIPGTLTCSGTKTYTYFYTDCNGETAEWTFTYHIMPELVITKPPTIVTVDCLDGVYNPVNELEPIMVNCGVTIDSPQLLSTTYNPPESNFTCEGTVTYTFRYFDCAGNYADWDYIFQVKVPELVIDEEIYPTYYNTVSCISEIYDPIAEIPQINDACGNPITNVFQKNIINNPPGFTCNGTRTYVYRYTDCAGHTADWNYVFQVEREPFTINTTFGLSTVDCIADIDPPTPPGEQDACGNDITDIKLEIVDDPKPLACNGSRTYKYTYRDCAGNTAVWEHVFNIVMPNTLTFTGGQNSANVSCKSEMVEPWQYLPVVEDACGNVITNPIISEPLDTPHDITCEGTRVYTCTYINCNGFEENWVFTYYLTAEPFTINQDMEKTVSCISAALIEPHNTEPSVMPNVTDYCGNIIEEYENINVDYDTLNCQGSVTYTYTFANCVGLEAEWQYKYNIVPQQFIITENYRDTIIECLDLASVLPHTITPSVMPPVYDYCDNDISNTFELTDTIPASDCNGYVEYVYTYTDCAGFEADWRYRYIIEMPQFEMTAEPGEETVLCKSDAYKPDDLLPVVFDYCGDTITNIVYNNVVYNPTPFVYAGTATYHYTYYDCAGNSAPWTYTFNITGPEELIISTEPGNVTVNCLSDVVTPTHLLPAVYDQCGILLNNPQYLGYTDEPNPITCIGTRVYRYEFTDVAGHTAEWTYTYNVAPSVGPSVPGDMQSTITNIADAVVPPLPVIYDACHNIITPTIEQEDEPNPLACQGTRKYTFTYEDCAGNTSQWSYTYILVPNNLYLNLAEVNNGCSGGNGGEITVEASGGTPPYIYCWKKDSGQVFNSDPTYNETYTYTNLFTGTYEVYVLDANGCRQNLFDAITIEMNQGYYGTDVKRLCESELPLTYGDTIIETPGLYEIIFKTQFGCDSIINLTLYTFPSYFIETFDTICANDLPYLWYGQSLTESGIYTAHLQTVANRCDSIYEINLEVINALEITEIGEIHGETECVFSSDVFNGEFIYTIDPVEGATHYEWEIHDAPWHIVHDYGTVCTLYVRTRDVGTITVQAFNDCGSSPITSITMNAHVSIDNIDGENITIYPNPANDIINIKFENYDGETNISIYDTSGKLIDEIDANFNSKVEIIQHNISSYKHGMYFIQIRNKKKSTTERIVIQH
ncbi:T9SS type A sorting domain-containing protein [Bacteroidales bacterium OttesenSCG-928-K03]|nr:T9SS type A sorting domain-containing protein [Odoribacter sp. OttesenSCG-928-L07]MDL2239354.1 T9SS type A sorting domain-containing protein [Bacteroidales bacterium OttesenSCG-928-L14]MDL2240569.1 T9SS type A sorting domain-containing protein [Bacteroidales bacterium OttesenSCG-928-K22]MDL2242649.1 T9SS type A sorting domain-containing protein [Bacteroidales bacterium OttesenSCG-928-K03]